jgi:hypothetical protein
MDDLFGVVVRVPGYRSRGPEFDSRRYQIFWEVVGLEQGPLSLLRVNGRGYSLRWPRDTIYPLKLALTSPTSGCRSVGKICWRTEAPEFVFVCLLHLFNTDRLKQ